MSKKSKAKSAQFPANLNRPVDPTLQELLSPHIDSFNYFLTEGLPLAIKHLDKVICTTEEGEEAKWWIEEIDIGYPSHGPSIGDHINPSQCREAGLTYAAPIRATLSFKQRGLSPVRIERKIGSLPIMVKSIRCHLHGLNQQQLVNQNEEPNELGGYFIVNGLEKIIRMLIVPRRNDICSVVRPSFNRIGSAYSPYATIIRCVRNDQSSQTITLHYLTDGNCNVRFILGRQEFFIPAIVLLKAFTETTDKEIFDKIVQRDTNNTFIMDNVELLLRETKKLGVLTQAQALVYLGSRFRVALRQVSNRQTDKQVGEFLLRRYIFVHLEKNQDKFELLIFMLQKLYSLVRGDSQPDNSDSPMNQEVLLAGHLYLMLLKEKLQEWLNSIRFAVLKMIKDSKKVLMLDESTFRKAIEKTSDVGDRVKYFLSTGNIVSETGLDLMQASGFCIIAEKLNYLRYIAHFRCIHRGAFFAEMKTTSVRKLLPDAWGFLCPVHTPDGAPCGLLNHLTRTCKVITQTGTFPDLPPLLASLGMSPIAPSVVYPKEYLTVFLDGRVIGKLKPELASHLVTNLRYLKVKRQRGVPPQLEIALVLPAHEGRFPGLFLFTSPARMMRPVKYLATGETEFIGSFEQVYLNIACLSEDVKPGVTTHQEIDPTNVLSVVANLTPFSDFNQSPRNMYQCQMGKQSLATPCHSYEHRVDNKIYRIQTPQMPLVRTAGQISYSMNDYPTGTNAVVVVISYTGYDMEDAMIINKSSYERGFAHASVYKSEQITLQPVRKRKNQPLKYFSNEVASGNLITNQLDPDGLPSPGQKLKKGDPLYCVFDEGSGEHRITRYKSNEECYVDQVRILGTAANGKIDNVYIKLRYNRNPVIGDKFSSRHGQKGVLSRLWPQIDMPFSESGLTPDVIINPHAFPSRMTIGMLVESLAGKSGALHGIYQDATPFRFDEKNTALSYFGDQLVKAGFNYYGNEPMYSGTTGKEFKADIYLGVVYYQRLRHMVKDKYQVRSTGPINQVTHQPIKGRKVGGGIRFGEMERDSLLAHGTSFLLHDRLMNCSDASKAFVCRHCGSLLSPVSKPKSFQPALGSAYQATCSYCESDTGLEVVAVPYVFKYLSMELAAMNIRMTLFTEGK